MSGRKRDNELNSAEIVRGPRSKRRKESQERSEIAEPVFTGYDGDALLSEMMPHSAE